MVLNTFTRHIATYIQLMLVKN